MLSLSIPTLVIIWTVTGLLSVFSMAFMDWYEGIDITAKELLLTSLAGMAIGPLSLPWSLGSVFKSIWHVLCAILSPFNFTIKGRSK